MEKKEKKIEEKDRVEMKVEETVKGELKVDAKGKKKRKPLSKKAKIALWCSIASFAIIAVLLPILLIVVFEVNKCKTPPPHAFYYEAVIVNQDGVDVSGYKITSLQEKYRKDVEHIVIPEEYDGLPVVEIGEDLFLELDSAKITDLTVSKYVSHLRGIEIYGGMAAPGMKNIFVDEENQWFCDIDGVLFSKDKKTLLSYPMAKEGSVYTVPKECTTLGVCAFFASRNLVTINAESVTSINRYPEDGKTNDEVVDMVFFGSVRLENLNMKNYYGIISMCTFTGCRSLKTVDFPLVYSIDPHAFLSCANLKEANLPKVTKLGYACFNKCKNLEKIIISGSSSLTYVTGSLFDLSAFYTSLDQLYGMLLESMSKWYKYDIGIKGPNIIGTIKGYAEFTKCSNLDEIVFVTDEFNELVTNLLVDDAYEATKVDVYFETQALVDAFNSWYAGTKFVAHVSE